MVENIILGLFFVIMRLFVDAEIPCQRAGAGIMRQFIHMGPISSCRWDQNCDARSAGPKREWVEVFAREVIRGADMAYAMSDMFQSSCVIGTKDSL